MGIVQAAGIERPGLAAALSARGLRLASPGSLADISFGTAAGFPPAGPAVIEVIDAAEATALLDAGADDVVLASDSDALAAARLAGLLRRTRAHLLSVGDLTLDLAERRAFRRGRPLPLFPREFALLACLARAGGAVVSPMALRQLVCGRSIDPGTNVLAVHVSRLRAKLGRGVAAPRLLTQKGEGYRLLPPFADGAEQPSVGA